MLMAILRRNWVEKEVGEGGGGDLGPFCQEWVTPINLCAVSVV